MKKMLLSLGLSCAVVFAADVEEISIQSKLFSFDDMLNRVTTGQWISFKQVEEFDVDDVDVSPDMRNYLDLKFGEISLPDLKERAEMEHPTALALYNMGLHYHYEGDDENATIFFERAHEKEFPQAAYKLGLLDEAIELGHEKARAKKGLRLHEDEQVVESGSLLSQAFDNIDNDGAETGDDLLMQAFDNGYIRAAVFAGDRQRLNEAYDAAADLYKQAAQQGSLEALVALGDLYRKGLLGEQNMDQAAYYYEVAADAGSLAARYKIGKLLEETEKEEALGIYQDLAEEGYLKAVARLCDLDANAQWYEQGYELTQDVSYLVRLGNMYIEQGTPAAALATYRQAIEAGSTIAKYQYVTTWLNQGESADAALRDDMIAYCLEFGDGCYNDGNTQLSLDWYDRYFNLMGMNPDLTTNPEAKIRHGRVAARVAHILEEQGTPLVAAPYSALALEYSETPSLLAIAQDVSKSFWESRIGSFVSRFF